MKLKRKKTHRGFPYYEFRDRYDVPCSLQKSSLAFEDAIWLGTDDEQPRVLKQGKGWVDYPMPEEYSVNTRMHLTRFQVFRLLPVLLKFVLTGKI